MKLLNKFVLLLLISGQVAWSIATNPAVLDDVQNRIHWEILQGGKPIVVFDIDDTLTQTRSRTQRILREFAASDEIQQLYPGDAKRISAVSFSEVRYELRDTFKNLNITNEALFKRANDYWVARFFSSDYCRFDLPLLGASAYVQQAHTNGAIVIYLTGRDRPRMEGGTIENLRLNGFPLDERAILMMKPTKEQDDLSFKKAAFDWIDTQGTVIAGFENEPVNINAFKHRWDDATLVFLDTIHSNKPDIPEPGIEWVKDYRRGQSLEILKVVQ